MAQQTRIFLFGDQTYDFVPKLRELLPVADNPILTAFLDQAHYVVRAQMMQDLPPAEHKKSRTSSLSQMLQKYCVGDLNPAFQTALSCICQLGCFMRQFGEQGRSYPSPEDTYVLGLCTGSLAAAAISSCSTLSELLPAAVQTVQVAFRLGMCVVRMRDRIEPPSDELPREWSILFSDLEPEAAQSEINDFCKANILPKSMQPWITATSAKTTTISGPPSTLKGLMETSPFSSLKSRKIPIFVPSHTSHLFSIEDVKAILETTLAKDWAGYSVKIPVISSETGKLSWVGNLRALLERALSECLLEPLHWDKIEHEFPALLKSRDTGSIVVNPIATSAERALATCLKNFATVEISTSVPEKTNVSHRSAANKQKLAIVGTSGRFPEAKDTDAFWDLLYKGLDVCKEVPRKRWNVDTHVDPSGKAHNKGATPWGCWLDFAADFDPKFFSISPKEAPQMDPAQRMALMSTYEAMERAGIVPDTTSSTQRNRIGVFHGVTSNDWMETNTAQNIDTYFITGGNRGFIPGRINFCFEFSGPSYTNDTACSSSLAAIHLACNSLWRGDCDTAVAGGTNMIFTPDGHAGLDKGFFLSRTGNCKAFDDAADGYCRAEGVGTVFIKRLEDALTDNDPILAVILDTKTNHSAMSESMTRPHVGAQIDNMTSVLSTACVDPNSLSYIEMHGTGTQVGDAVEMESVLSVFAPTEKSRPRDRPLHVGSAKANIGHGEGVSGVTSLVKVLLMMKNDTIVPHCGIKPGSKINHNYPDLGARNVHIAFEPKPWPRKQQPRRVLINNFSAAGGNTALLLEDAPIREVSTEVDPRACHIFAVSAHVGKSLKKNLESLLEFVTRREGEGISLPQLSYTTTARRWHHLHRVSMVASSTAELKTKLQNAIAAGEGMTRSKAKPNLLMAFTGQGSQYLGMGKQLYDAYPRFRDEVNGFNQLAQNLGFPAFLPVFLQTEGDMDEFTPVEAQLAITCLQMALTMYLSSLGVTPSAVVGHSLGEYAALHAAGVLSASDTIYLVGKRAELLQTRCQRGTHAMLAVKASRTALSELLANKKYEVACINGPEDTVLSGTNEQIASAHRVVTSASLKSTQLKLPFAFHSAQVQPVLEDLKALAQGVTFHKPSVPVLSPLMGTVVDDSGIFGPSYIAQHCRETVNMEKVLLQAKESQLVSDKTITIEVGPQPLLSGMIKFTLGSNLATFPTLQRNKDAFLNLSNALSNLYNKGYDFNWVAYHEPFKSAHNVIELPSYSWDLKEYFIPYEGDWCLHRHKIDCSCADRPGMHDHRSETGAAPRTITEKAKPQVTLESTTCVHTVVEETTAPLGATLVVETDVNRADTSHVVQGHQVNHIALCTPSVYADIAFTVGKYTMDKLRSSHTGAIDGVVDVSDLVVEKALIPHGQGRQILRTTLSISWPPKAAASARSAKVEFSSMAADGKVDTKHAWCTVRFVNKSQLQSLQQKLPEYQAKVQRLREGTKTGKFVKYNRIAGYKLMSNVAHFHPDYKLLDNLVMDESSLEACSQLSFDRIQSGGTFYAHPAAVDAITQVGGFAMNAKDSTDLDVDVYVNHGWESFQIYEPLANGIMYETYVQMHSDKKGNLCHGDTIVFDGDRVVAFFKGLSLRNVPRKALRMVLQQSFDKGARQNGKAVAANLDYSVGPAPKPIIPKQVSAPAKVSVPVTFEPAPAITTPVQPGPTAPEPALVKASVTLATETAATVQSDNATIIAAINIIAEESGIALEELTDESNFTESGIDSLGSMVISSRFREELDLDLPTDFSVFTDLPTVRDLKIFLGGKGAPEPAPAAVAASHPTTMKNPEDSTSASDADTSENENEQNSSESEPEEVPLKLYPYCKPATSVILQGIPKVAEKILFMLPDGGGSASSYAPIPRLRADVAIIGLNCPYARDPENMNCTHIAMIESFCTEIRRRQPKGPYHLGGWSSGGAFAYVTAEALVNQGEEVHSLIIIDAPVPQVMEKLPVSFYEYCNTVGLFANQPGGGASEPPPYLVPHFVAVVDVMMDYKVALLNTKRMPKVGIIWASETVMDENNAPKMKGMHFMIQKREDFGPDGWDEVMPGAEFDIVRAEGANHFSLMQKQNINLVSDLIERVMA